MNLRFETLKLSDLISDPHNARKHDKRNITAIKGSLSQFGQRKPIVITPANVVVAGNGTVEAAKELGWIEILVVKTPDDWSPEKIKAYALADNRTSELAEWDPSILAEQLIDLEILGFDIAELGFIPNGENASDFLNDLQVDGNDKDDGAFISSETYPLPFGFTAQQRELIISSINKAKSAGQSDAPTALAWIAQQYLEDKYEERKR